MNAWQPNFNWITELLAVGGSFPSEQAETLAREHGVRAVVDLRGEAVPDPHVLRRHGMTLLHLPTEDMCGVEMPDLEHGIRFVNSFLDEGLAVLIHCEHGIGRSATLALCVLVHRGMSPLEALALMKRQRPLVSPSPVQFECWCAWLDSYRFTNEVDWQLPSFEEFKALAYATARR
ncbi:dual specificity protein phosphatase family protein [Variovorax paradoxus]|nr:dual specificity protein phosphatase family protein [Variovorax paradoxus]